MKSRDERPSLVDISVSTVSRRGRLRPRPLRRRGFLAGVAAVVCLLLAACNGGGPPPHVASLNTTTTSATSGGGTPTSSSTTTPTGDVTVLLDQWATCMRNHGDPNQADPTVDANGVIHITWNPATPGGYDGTDKGGQGNLGPGAYCRRYLKRAQSILQEGQNLGPPSQARLLAFSKCMQVNGVPDFPDPIDGNLSFNRAAGGDLNPDNPTFQRASKICVQKTGTHVPGATGPPPGSIELNGAAAPGGTGSDTSPGTGSGG